LGEYVLIQALCSFDSHGKVFSSNLNTTERKRFQSKKSTRMMGDQYFGGKPKNIVDRKHNYLVGV
jgi:hypothetical protein